MVDGFMYPSSWGVIEYSAEIALVSNILGVTIIHGAAEALNQTYYR